MTVTTQNDNVEIIEESGATKQKNKKKINYMNIQQSVIWDIKVQVYLNVANTDTQLHTKPVKD